MELDEIDETSPKVKPEPKTKKGKATAERKLLEKEAKQEEKQETMSKELAKMRASLEELKAKRGSVVSNLRPRKAKVVPVPVQAVPTQVPEPVPVQTVPTQVPEPVPVQLIGKDLFNKMFFG